MRSTRRLPVALLLTLTLAACNQTPQATTPAASPGTSVQAQTFPGTNGRIVFTSRRDGNEEIYAVDADGSAQLRLTNSGERDADASWSPDGRRVAYAHADQLWVMNADGSGQRQLTSTGLPALSPHPTWSPDGQQILFLAFEGLSFSLFIINADGSGRHRITPLGAVPYTSPAWSPDGRRIAFEAVIGNSQTSEIYVINTDGSDRRQLTSNTNSSRPVWSPDGSRLTFDSTRDGNYEVYVMNADGSGQTRLTNHTANDFDPAWSPDGQRLAFASLRDGDSEIYTMRADGTDVQQLTSNGESDRSPDWQAVPNQPPTVTISGVEDGATYELGRGLAATCRATDDRDAPSSPAVTFSDLSGPLAAHGAGTQTASCTFTDRGGLSASASVTYTVTDTTAPTLNPTVTPAGVLQGGTAAASPNASDAPGTGIASAQCGPVTTTVVGPQQVTCTATDRAGNTATAQASYAVGYDFRGFLSPVDNLPTVNIVKAGSAVPVKFSLKGDQGLGILATGYPKVTAAACGTLAPTDEIEQSVTAGSSGLQYDPLSDTYTYVWKTDKAARGCAEFVLRLNDGVERRFALRYK